MGKPEPLSGLESKLGYTFRDKTLLETALTHSSFANEQEDGSVSYERLEFLGDAVIGLETALLIFEEAPELAEGQMTQVRAALVRAESLAEFARGFGLGEYIRLGVGAGRTDVRKNDAVLEDVFEALIAAVFLDGGTDEARKLIRSLFEEPVRERLSGIPGGMPYVDYKSRLQEVLQKDGAAKIHYKVLAETGPDHNKRFLVSVVSEGKKLGTGAGKTKKTAERMAAKMALEGLKCI